MKRCPECGRNYNDDSMSFCLDDGAELLFGPAQHEPATAILGAYGVPPSGGGADDNATQLLVRTTTGEDPRSAIRHPQSGGPAEGGTPNAFDRRLLLAPIALVVIVLGGFFGYKYLSLTTTQINSIA